MDNEKLSAADQYQAAFERLKANKPTRLAKGTLVSQNNVAREAGSDPSALRKSRFPTLIAEIQRYVTSQESRGALSARATRADQRRKRRSLKDRLDEVARQRDMLASKLCEADVTILALRAQIEQLAKYAPENNVIPLRQVHEKGGTK